MYDLVFCPFADNIRSQYCKLLEGQLVSKSQPCPYHKDCCQLVDDLAACYSQEKTTSTQAFAE